MHNQPTMMGLIIFLCQTDMKVMRSRTMWWASHLSHGGGGGGGIKNFFGKMGKGDKIWGFGGLRGDII